MAFWTDAAKHSPHAPLAHRNLGAMLYLDGKIDQSEPEFEKALELNPKNSNACFALGWLYRQQNRFAESEGLFKKAIEIEPLLNKGMQGITELEAKGYFYTVKQKSTLKNIYFKFILTYYTLPTKYATDLYPICPLNRTYIYNTLDTS